MDYFEEHGNQVLYPEHSIAPSFVEHMAAKQRTIAAKGA
jgi:hypothetical protein